jgi:hypothetical protein
LAPLSVAEQHADNIHLSWSPRTSMLPCWNGVRRRIELRPKAVSRWRSRSQLTPATLSEASAPSRARACICPPKARPPAASPPSLRFDLASSARPNPPRRPLLPPPPRSRRQARAELRSLRAELGLARVEGAKAEARNRVSTGGPPASWARGLGHACRAGAAVELAAVRRVARSLSDAAGLCMHALVYSSQTKSGRPASKAALLNQQESLSSRSILLTNIPFGTEQSQP